MARSCDHWAGELESEASCSSSGESLVNCPRTASTTSEDGVPATSTESDATQNNVMFKDMILKPGLKQAVLEAGFLTLSDIQQKSFPNAMSGLDIFCQAKAGTGKTAIFVITSLQELDADSDEQPSVLILVPTRELAFQIATEYQRFKKHMPNIRLGLFYGGTSLRSDIEKLRVNRVQIIVGTPGRLSALCDAGALHFDRIKILIVDECDEMLANNEPQVDVQRIIRLTPKEKQVMMFCSTLLPNQIGSCVSCMENPVILRIADEHDLNLTRLRQFYFKMVDTDKAKNLITLLDLLEYNQVIIFVNTVDLCSRLDILLNASNLSAISINSSVRQEDRLERYHLFKSFEKRILVATDLFGRGMDIEHVNIVINYDCPKEVANVVPAEVYLRRVGRAGRFNAKGCAITFTVTVADIKVIDAVNERFGCKISELPDEICADLYM